MGTPLTSEEIDKLARKRAGAKLGFYVHATVYVLVNLAMFAMSHYGFGNRRWSIYPVMAWGLGLALHGISVFVLGKGGGLRERMVQKERERLTRQHGDGP